MALIPPIGAIVTVVLAPEPHGHWTEHLSSVAFKGAMLVLLLALVSMLGWRTLSVPLLVCLGVVGIGILFQVRGDYQVADSVWRTSGDPGFGSGYSQGHDLSGLGDLLVMVGGLGFAITAGTGRRVSAWLAVLATVMVVIPPPFLWPAAGILMLVLHGLRSESRLTRVTPDAAT